MKENSEQADENLQVPELTTEEALVLGAPLDERANQEAEQFRAGESEEDLKARARRNEHGRSERFKDHFEKLARIGITIAFWASMILGVIWAWHVVAPEWLRWLKDEELDHLQNLITGGVLASLAGDHFKRRLS